MESNDWLDPYYLVVNCCKSFHSKKGLITHDFSLYIDQNWSLNILPKQTPAFELKKINLL